MNQDHGKARLLYYNRVACRECPLRSQCTTAEWRVVARRVNEAVVERAAARVAARPEMVARRKTIIEHIFGTLRLWGHDRFLMRGLEKVRAEFSLSALTYNLRRVLNLRSIEQLLAALRQPAAA
jgi:transposase